MAERVYPSAKTTTSPPLNGTTTNTTAVNGAAHTAPKPYNPAAPAPTATRPPYRSQPYSNNQPRRRYSRRSRCSCCCCIFWLVLVFLFFSLIAAIAGAAFWVLYHPHRPEFTVAFLAISNLNLTTSPDLSSTHLTTAFNLSISTYNPNTKITFFYDPFTATILSKSSVAIGNGSFPSFMSNSKNTTKLKLKLSTYQQDLDADSVTKLRSDLKKKNGLGLELKLDTKVRVEIGKLKSEKILIRVTCDGIHGVVPKSKSPSVALTSGAKCKVDLRFKIWKFTF